MTRGDDVKAVTIYVAFRIQDIVYLRTNSEKCTGMVVGLNCRPPGTSYLISWADGTKSEHYDIELTTEFIKTFDVETDDE